MKKTTLTIWFVVLFGFYIAYEKLNATQSVVLVSPSQNQTPTLTLPATPITAAAPPPTPPSNPIASNPGTTPKSTPPPTQPALKPTPTPPAAPAPTPKPVGMYKDGTYTGSSADAYYGNVQVQAIVSGGKLTDVQFLDYPQSHGTSVYINQQAMPYLTQEAIQAQNANVNIISGATFTSQAFVQSLGDALAQAKNS